MENSRRLLALLASCALAGGRGAEAQAMWTDSEGVVHLSDEAPPDQPRARRLVEQPLAPRAPAAAAQAARVPPAGAATLLKRFELPYLGREGGARRVIVQVRVNERLTVPMALDTGAPGMMLSIEAAEKVGAMSGDQGRLLVSAGGIGGEVPAVRTILDSVSIGGAVERFVPVTITASISDAFVGLIGMDFMSQYALTIDASRSVVVLQEQPALAHSPGGRAESWWRDTFTEFRTLREAWRRYRDRVDQQIRDSQVSAGASLDALVARRTLAEAQCQEADKLFSRLDRYASSQSVPRHWR